MAVGLTPVEKHLEPWLASMGHVAERTRFERRSAVERFSKWTQECVEGVTDVAARESVTGGPGKVD